jgi:hypothetical protein
MNTLRNAWHRVLQWMREHGLGWFGFVEHEVDGCCMLVYRWSFGVPARWEVWYFGAFGLMAEGQVPDIPMKRQDLASPWVTTAMKDHRLASWQQGSQARYTQLMMAADLVCTAKDVDRARAAIVDRNQRTAALLAGW